MNVDVSRCIRRLCAALLTAQVPSVFAATMLDGSSPTSVEQVSALQSNHGVTPSVLSPEYPYLINDPLQVRSAAIRRHVVLPGDSEPFSCRDLDASQPIGLNEAVDQALCHSPQVQAAWANVKLQAAVLGQSRASWLPTANATVSQLHNRTYYPGLPQADSTSSGHTVYGSVTWRLFDFGARAADNEASARLLQAALASHDAALQKALSTVVESYFDAVTARAALAGRTSSSQLAEQTLEATRRRESAGAAPLSDTLQARSAFAKARLAEQRAAGDFKKALAVLMYAIGLQVDVSLKLAEEPAVPQAEAVSELAAWLDEAESNHPSIVAARAQVQAARAKVDVVRMQGMPTLDFNGNYYQNGYPNQGLQPTRSSTTTIGVTLTIPLFEGFARTYQVRGAQAQVDQSEAQLRDTELQVTTTIVKDHADAASALANLGASSNWLDAAQESIASARRRYEKGAADILELLTAESEVAEAQQERVRCLSEWRSARLRLLADAGMLGRASIRTNASEALPWHAPSP